MVPRKYNLILRGTASLLAGLFLLQEISYCAPAGGTAILPPSPMARLLENPSHFEAPLDFASLQTIHKGTNGKLIIHIQDAHSNLSGQQNLAGALDAIMSKYGVSVVLSEGGEKDCSLTPLKKIGTPAIWKQVAKKYLFEGRIVGEEYLNLSSERPMKILGIEDGGLYWKSVRNYGALADKRNVTLSYLQSIQKALEKLKRKLYSPELLKYDGQVLADGKNFEASLKELLGLAKAHGIDLKDLSNLQKLIVLQAQEAKIDFNAANLEQAALVETISKRGGRESLESFLKKAGRAKSQKAAQFSNFQNLFEIAKEKNIAASAYPNLMLYGGYLKNFTEVDLDEVLDELSKAEDRVYLAALANPDARLVRSVDRYVRLLVTAYRIQMSTKDFKLFEANEPDFAMVSYLAFINRKLAEFGYFEDLLAYKDLLEEGEKALVAFYDSVDRRDATFLKNAERMLSEENQKVAVLITGGYHTPHLKKLFTEKGYSFAVLTPIVTGETNQKKYEDILLAPIRPKIKTVESVRGQTASDKPLSNLEKSILLPKKNDGVRATMSMWGPTTTKQAIEKDITARLNIAKNTPTSLADKVASGARLVEVEMRGNEFLKRERQIVTVDDTLRFLTEMGAWLRMNGYPDTGVFNEYVEQARVSSGVSGLAESNSGMSLVKKHNPDWTIAVRMDPIYLNKLVSVARSSQSDFIKEVATRLIGEAWGYRGMREATPEFKQRHQNVAIEDSLLVSLQVEYLEVKKQIEFLRWAKDLGYFVSRNTHADFSNADIEEMFVKDASPKEIFVRVFKRIFDIYITQPLRAHLAQAPKNQPLAPPQNPEEGLWRKYTQEQREYFSGGMNSAQIDGVLSDLASKLYDAKAEKKLGAFERKFEASTGARLASFLEPLLEQIVGVLSLDDFTLGMQHPDLAANVTPVEQPGIPGQESSQEFADLSNLTVPDAQWSDFFLSDSGSLDFGGLVEYTKIQIDRSSVVTTISSATPYEIFISREDIIRGIPFYSSSYRLDLGTLEITATHFNSWDLKEGRVTAYTPENNPGAWVGSIKGMIFYESLGGGSVLDPDFDPALKAKAEIVIARLEEILDAGKGLRTGESSVSGLGISREFTSYGENIIELRFSDYHHSMVLHSLNAQSRVINGIAQSEDPAGFESKTQEMLAHINRAISTNTDPAQDDDLLAIQERVAETLLMNENPVETSVAYYNVTRDDGYSVITTTSFATPEQIFISRNYIANSIPYELNTFTLDLDTLEITETVRSGSEGEIISRVYTPEYNPGAWVGSMKLMRGNEIEGREISLINHDPASATQAQAIIPTLESILDARQTLSAADSARGVTMHFTPYGEDIIQLRLSDYHHSLIFHSLNTRSHVINGIAQFQEPDGFALKIQEMLSYIDKAISVNTDPTQNKDLLAIRERITETLLVNENPTETSEVFRYSATQIDGPDITTIISSVTPLKIVTSISGSSQRVTLTLNLDTFGITRIISSFGPEGNPDMVTPENNPQAWVELMKEQLLYQRQGGQAAGFNHDAASQLKAQTIINMLESILDTRKTVHTVDFTKGVSIDFTSYGKDIIDLQISENFSSTHHALNTKSHVIDGVAQSEDPVGFARKIREMLFGIDQAIAANTNSVQTKNLLAIRERITETTEVYNYSVTETRGQEVTIFTSSVTPFELIISTGFVFHGNDLQPSSYRLDLETLGITYTFTSLGRQTISNTVTPENNPGAWADSINRMIRIDMEGRQVARLNHDRASESKAEAIIGILNQILAARARAAETLSITPVSAGARLSSKESDETTVRLSGIYGPLDSKELARLADLVLDDIRIVAMAVIAKKDNGLGRGERIPLGFKGGYALISAENSNLVTFFRKPELGDPREIGSFELTAEQLKQGAEDLKALRGKALEAVVGIKEIPAFVVAAEQTIRIIHSFNAAKGQKQVQAGQSVVLKIIGEDVLSDHPLVRAMLKWGMNVLESRGIFLRFGKVDGNGNFVIDDVYDDLNSGVLPEGEVPESYIGTKDSLRRLNVPSGAGVGLVQKQDGQIIRLLDTFIKVADNKRDNRVSRIRQNMSSLADPLSVKMAEDRTLGYLHRIPKDFNESKEAYLKEIEPLQILTLNFKIEEMVGYIQMVMKAVGTAA